MRGEKWREFLNCDVKLIWNIDTHLNSDMSETDFYCAHNPCQPWNWFCPSNGNRSVRYIVIKLLNGLDYDRYNYVYEFLYVSILN